MSNGLQDTLDDLREQRDECEASEPATAMDAGEAERLAQLEAIADEVGDDLDDLIPEREWRDYARECAEAIGALPRWIEPYIDWERWADDLQSDYTVFEFDGETYYWRG